MVAPSLQCVTDGGVPPPTSVDSPPVKSTPQPLPMDQTPPERRSSARIQAKQRIQKEILIRKRVRLLDGLVKQDSTPKPSPAKRTRVYTRRGDTEASNGDAEPEQHVLEPKQKKNKTKKKKEEQVVDNAARQIDPDIVSSDALPAGVSGKSAHAQVVETLRTFNKFYLNFVQEEESRCGRKKDAGKQSPKSKSKIKPKVSLFLDDSGLIAFACCHPIMVLKKPGKREKVAIPDAKPKSMRPDLKAATKMSQANAILYPKKTIGNLPGIEVGHQFYSRAEMVVIGIHSHWLSGIDYIGASNQKEFQNYKLPLAVSIVLSGMYEDDLDNADDVSYTGQGGHNLTGDKRQCKDQVMERGNLALKNCVDQSVPVRVIRGHVCKSSYVGKIYTYDGLYKVEKCWAEKGISGFTVFRYGLKRLKDQPVLTTNQFSHVANVVYRCALDVKESQDRIRYNSQMDVFPRLSLKYEGWYVMISLGGLRTSQFQPQIWLMIHLSLQLASFTYLKTTKIAKSVKLPQNAVGCSCKGTCVDPRTCACAKLNGSDFPYVHRDGGRLIEAKDVVYECGPSCGCGPSCVNRASQRGLRHRLEVFRTPKKGWAVRSWDFIYSGSPVCEYVGVLKKTEDVDSLTGNDYIFDIDCLQTMRGLGGRERRSRDASLPDSGSIASDSSKSDSGPEFCIDAGPSGNVARFINHSCSPNLFVQCVLSSHQDLRLARVVLFAADNIPPLQELTYDYGYALDSVMGPNGKIKRVPCFCGGADCRKRLY
ncbi:Histone-lysine N-methyltransferase, H3 lysine-9 specific SUVH4 [Linum perenne]